MPDVEKKIRIQTFDKDLNMLSDRLVTQYTEFNKGPAEVHKGPMKIEVSLFTKEDVVEFKTYLDMLVGVIPIAASKKKRGRKKAPKDVEGFREYMVGILKGIEKPTDALVIKACREQGMVFTSLEFLKDMGYPILVPKIHRKYRFMAQLVKKAKNPLNDKYNPSLLVGFKGTKVVVYSAEELLLELSVKPDEHTSIKIPAKVKVKFPVYLTQEERNKFRAEMQILKDNPEKKPTKWYERWVHKIAKESPEGIKFPRIETIPNPYDKA